jgi:hypothetical protein
MFLICAGTRFVPQLVNAGARQAGVDQVRRAVRLGRDMVLQRRQEGRQADGEVNQVSALCDSIIPSPQRWSSTCSTFPQCRPRSMTRTRP